MRPGRPLARVRRPRPTPRPDPGRQSALAHPTADTLRPVDARTQDISTADDVLDVPPASAQAPHEWVDFRSLSTTLGMWVAVRNGAPAGDGAPGSIYFGPRETCRRRYATDIHVAGEGDVRVNVVAYTDAEAT